MWRSRSRLTAPTPSTAWRPRRSASTRKATRRRCPFCLLADAITPATPRPANGQVVHVTQDGELLFGGLINSVAETALAQPNLAGLRWRVTARDWTYVADVTIVLSLEVTAGTDSLALAEMIRATYLDDRWGVLPNGPLAGGPTLPRPPSAMSRCGRSSTGSRRRRATSGASTATSSSPCTRRARSSGPTFTAANARIINQFGWSKQAIDRYTRLWLAVTITEAAQARGATGQRRADVLPPEVGSRRRRRAR